MAWRDSTTHYSSSDNEISKTVTATSGKSIKAGGYWISASTNSQLTVRVNGPSTDENGVGVQWSVQGWFPSPPAGGYDVTIYVYEE